MSKAYELMVNRGNSVMGGAGRAPTIPPMTMIQKPRKPIMPKPIITRPAENMLRRRMPNANQQ